MILIYLIKYDIESKRLYYYDFMLQYMEFPARKQAIAYVAYNVIYAPNTVSPTLLPFTQSDCHLLSF